MMMMELESQFADRSDNSEAKIKESSSVEQTYVKDENLALTDDASQGPNMILLQAETKKETAGEDELRTKEATETTLKKNCPENSDVNAENAFPPIESNDERDKVKNDNKVSPQKVEEEFAPSDRKKSEMNSEKSSSFDTAYDKNTEHQNEQKSESKEEHNEVNDKPAVYVPIETYQENQQHLEQEDEASSQEQQQKQQQSNPVVSTAIATATATATPVSSRGRQPRQLLEYKPNPSTAIVHSMFGSSVGQCFGDYPCHYNRRPGNLFACTEAILFYSNLFGFEKKLCFRYRDIQEMQLYRSTSIQISVQGESEDSKNDFIFKGFLDRIMTQQLLVDLWQHNQGAENIEAPNENNETDDAVDTTTERNNDSDAAIARAGSDPILPPGRSLSPTGAQDDLSIKSAVDAVSSQQQHQQQIRRRTSSAEFPKTPPSILKSSKLATPQRKCVDDLPESETPSRRLFIPSPTRRSRSLPPLHRRRQPAKSKDSTPAKADDSLNLDQAPSESDQKAWEAIKASEHACIDTIGIESLSLPCSLHTFYRLFLADNARHSFEAFQQSDAVRDLDISVSPWKEEKNGVLVRTLSFEHPVSKSYGIGPSHTLTTKQQRLYRHPGCGLCLTSSTSVEGVPAADCFTVKDHWVVETNSSNGVILSIKFGADFHKRTILKSVIVKNIRSSTKEWFQGYESMVQEAVKDQPGTTAKPAVAASEIDSSAENHKAGEFSLVGGPKILVVALALSQLATLLFLLFILQELRTSQQTSNNLLREIVHLRIEQGQVLNLLMAQ